MTDIEILAKKLLQRIEWQNVPDVVTREDLTIMIADAIRHLYVMTGRALQFDEAKFVFEDGMYKAFEDELKLDEREYVIVTATLAFFDKVKQSVSDMTSYSTDAMTVTQGDKPFANMNAISQQLRDEQRTLYYKLVRFNML